MTDSSTGGVLTPSVSPAPLGDAAFDDLLQELISAITGIDGTLVRPRWQPEPPNQPGQGVSWIAFGAVDLKGDTYAAVLHSPTDDGCDTIFRQEHVRVLVSCYGPTARNLASLLREGLSVPQNRDALVAQQVQLISVGDLTVLPALINERWQYRVDVSLELVRAVLRTYPVLNLLTAEGEIVTDTTPPLTVPINVA